MASEQQHIVQAARNQEVAELLATGGYHDWAITALFYSAMHLIQAYLVQSGRTANSHWQRRQWIRNLTELRPVLAAFDELQAYSENARYECRNFSQSEFEVAESESYRTVVSHLRSLTS